MVEFLVKERSCGNTFPVRETSDAYALEHDLPHEILALNETWDKAYARRYARVLATVAYVAVDEDEKGNPVLEKWQIRRI